NLTLGNLLGAWRCTPFNRMGFLPHSNVGPLSIQEMQLLKQVNVSMGLMLEQLTPNLLKGVHRHAPSKLPSVRLQQLEWAGQLRIPFTTGLLLGIGETEDDWDETLTEIANIHRVYGHIQEVILQPHQPGEQQKHLGQPCDDTVLLAAVKRAKAILPPDITIQIPPNLVRSPQTILACINAGVTDLGGIGTLDEVNPTYHHQSLEKLATMLNHHGYGLKPRLPIYPQYDRWLPAHLQQKLQFWRTKLEREYKS
ncbi:MAG: 7,8-didemethyl-8-hydroxy-5-deazariboflavin synthase subunit CofG, partial [Cyanobacteria bacterium J06642_11]